MVFVYSIFLKALILIFPEIHANIHYAFRRTDTPIPHHQFLTIFKKKSMTTLS